MEKSIWQESCHPLGNLVHIECSSLVLVREGYVYCDCAEDLHQRVLQGGVSRPESRYRVVYPENSPRMPSRLSLTAKLLSSPRAMRRLSIACKDRLAVIIPSIGVPLLLPLYCQSCPSALDPNSVSS